MLYDRTTQEKKLRRWEEKLAALERARPGDETLERRVAKIREGIDEARRAFRHCRSKLAEIVWALRATSRETRNALGSAWRHEASEDKPPCAIRFAAAPPGPCARCGREAAAGLVGWREVSRPGPLCDSCLTQLDKPLGALLAVVNFLREAGELSWIRREEEMTLRSVVIMMGGLQEASAFEDLGRRPIDLEEQLLPLLGRLEASYAGAEEWETAVAN